MNNVELLKEAARKQQKPKQRKRKPAGGRKERDLYAMDMSKGAPGTKPKTDFTSQANKFQPDNPKPAQPKLQSKVVGDSGQFTSTSKGTGSTRKPQLPATVKTPRFSPKKLGLIGAGLAGTGILAAKIRANRKAKESQ